jgi:hypothetical protein
MTDGAAHGPPADSIDRLNVLLRGELAAVAAYQRALRAIDGKIPVDGGEILRFAAEHQRTVATLQAAVHSLGGTPAAETGTWGAFERLRDTVSVHALLAGEEAGLAEYEAALPSLLGDPRELVEKELIPRQRRQIAALSTILADLSR